MPNRPSAQRGPRGALYNGCLQNAVEAGAHPRPETATYDPERARHAAHPLESADRRARTVGARWWPASAARATHGPRNRGATRNACARRGARACKSRPQGIGCPVANGTTTVGAQRDMRRRCAGPRSARAGPGTAGCLCGRSPQPPATAALPTAREAHDQQAASTLQGAANKRWAADEQHCRNDCKRPHHHHGPNMVAKSWVRPPLHKVPAVSNG